MFPASNGHRGWNCWWQLGNSYESNKESLRHKTQVSHLRTSHLPSHSPHSAGCLSGSTDAGVRLPKQRVHRLRRAFVSITALTLANKQGRQTIILHYIHDYSTLHFLSAQQTPWAISQSSHSFFTASYTFCYTRVHRWSFNQGGISNHCYNIYGPFSKAKTARSKTRSGS